MKVLGRTGGFIALVMAVGLGAAVASESAEVPASPIVQARMDAMRAMKNDVKLIDDMLSGKKYLSVKRLQMTLDKIDAGSGEAMLKLFPQGSAGKPSDADPKIWTQWDDFTQLAGHFKQVAGQFSAAARAGAGADQLKENYHTLREACKSCHDKYRL